MNLEQFLAVGMPLEIGRQRPLKNLKKMGMPCSQLEQTVVSVSRAYRHFGASDRTAVRV